MPGPEGPLVSVRSARPEDVATLLAMFTELAVYERLEHLLEASEESIHAALFGSPPAAEGLIGEVDGETAGYAIFFPTFSTFLARQGVWLEDLFVRPAQRKSGLGRALLATVAARTRERGGERLEWSALDWNELALGFYRKLGAEQMGDWITHRLRGESLYALAAEGTPDLGAGRR